MRCYFHANRIGIHVNLKEKFPQPQIDALVSNLRETFLVHIALSAVFYLTHVYKLVVASHSFMHLMWLLNWGHLRASDPVHYMIDFLAYGF